MSVRYDDAIAGAGILGLAHAYHLAKRGRKVVVFERSPRAQGASIRNFGMIWPIGQPAGLARETALRSRKIWGQALQESGIWHEEVGSLHLAYQEDELQVLREFVQSAPAQGYDVSLLSPMETLQRSPVVRKEGLLGAIWSASEMCVDPRQVIAELPAWLAKTYGVTFQFGYAVSGYRRPHVTANGETWAADNFYLCAGDDVRTLYPELLQAEGMTPCKLQMMRSQPFGERWKLGPMLAAGLTLRHYKNFEGCPSLPALKARIAQETPQYDQFGVHVMASQNGRGEVIIGDSHEYGDAIVPFDNPEIDALILDYLQTFLEIPSLQIAARWHGIYAKHPSKPFVILRPEEGVTVVTGVGGAGMTLSFGVAERAVQETLGETNP